MTKQLGLPGGLDLRGLLGEHVLRLRRFFVLQKQLAEQQTRRHKLGTVRQSELELGARTVSGQYSGYSAWTMAASRAACAAAALVSPVTTNDLLRG